MFYICCRWMVRLTLSYRGKEKHYSTCVFPVILPYMPFMMFNFKNREILESRKTQFFSDYLFNIHISQRNRVKVTIIDMYDNTQHQFCVDSCQIIKKKRCKHRFIYNGGPDGTRTHDLLRDREAC